MDRKSVLMCCYYFPPFARSGGMRSLQFARHLRELGWDVHVLTVDPGLYASPIDPASTAEGYETLDVSDVTRIDCGAPARRPSRARDFVATLRDPLLAEGHVIRRWVNAAAERAAGIVRSRPRTVVYVGCHPYASVDIGLRLQRRFGTRWLADFSDPWTLDEAGVYSSILHFRRQQSCFRTVLRRADAVVANTPDAMAAMVGFEPRARARLSVVTYGYDRQNVPAGPSAALPRDGSFVIAHLGGIEVTAASSSRRNPLRYRPYDTDITARGTHHLLTALELLRSQRPDVFAKLRLRVVAPRTENDIAAVQARGMAERFEWTGSLANDRALAEVARAHAALVLQQAAPAGHRLRTVRAKTYEYMALGKPILACVPAGDGSDFVARYGRGLVCDPADARAIADGLVRLHDDHGTIANAPVDTTFVEGFEWGVLARRLDAALSPLAV
jgi:glycosyltransferase involved in cell wall biosynthesis